MAGAKQHSGLKPEIVEELKEDFDFADSDQDGRIDFTEFKCLLDNLEADMSDTDLRIGFREIDSDHDGRISLGEFAAWWAQE